MQSLGDRFLEKGKTMVKEAEEPKVPVLGPGDITLTFEEKFNIIGAYLKTEELSKWCLSVAKVTDKEFIIYQGSFANVWARFKEGKGITWNHERLSRRMHRDLSPEVFE